MRLFRTFLAAALFAVLALGLTACGKTDRYTLDIQCGEGGKVTASAPAEDKGYKAGETVTLTVSPDAGYTLDTFTVNGAPASPEGNKYTFEIGQNTVVKATFASETPAVYYQITTAFDAARGSLTLTPSAASAGYAAGEEVTLTVTAKAGYAVGAVKVGGGEVTLTDGKYTFKVEGNTSVSAEFSVRYYHVESEYESAQGLVSLSPSAAREGYVYGETVTVTLSPAAFYAVGAVKVNGTTLAAQSGIYSFTVSDDAVVTVEFTAIPASFAPGYRGAWTEYGGTRTLEISQTELKADGAALSAVGDEEVGYFFTWGGVSYNAFLTDDGYALYLTGGAATLYFVQNGLPDLKVEEAMFRGSAFLSKDGARLTTDASGALKAGESDARLLTLVPDASGVNIGSTRYDTVLSGTAFVGGAWYEIYFADYANKRPSAILLVALDKTTQVYEQQYAAATAFDPAYRGTWKMIYCSTANAPARTVTVPETGATFTRDSDSFTVQAFGMDGYIFAYGTWNSTLRFLNADRTVLVFRSGNLTEFYVKNDAEVGAFPASWYNTKWDNDSYGRLAVDGTGRATVEGDLMRYFPTENGNENVGLALYNDECWFISREGDTVSLLNVGLNGAAGYSFGKVGAATFDADRQGVWEEVVGTQPSATDTFTVGEKSVTYLGQTVIAEEMSRFDAYVFTIAGQAYTFGVRPDGILWLCKGEVTLSADAAGNPVYDNAEDCKFFLRRGRTYGTATLDSVLPQSYFGKTYKCDGAEFVLSADGKSATIYGKEIRFISAEANGESANFIATGFADGVFYEFAFANGAVTIATIEEGVKQFN